MGVNSLPKTVTRQRRGCDLNRGPSAPESSMLTTQLPSDPITQQQPANYVTATNCRRDVVVSGVRRMNKLDPRQARERTCHMRSHSVTCHPAEVTFPLLPQQSWYSIK